MNKKKSNFPCVKLKNRIAIGLHCFVLSNIHHEMNIWEFRYATFFAVTTFTTIGYGFQAPVTTGGRLFTFLYGLPAICIFVVLVQKIGVILLEMAGYYGAKLLGKEKL